jgi:GTP-binding protein HflX
VLQVLNKIDLVPAGTMLPPGAIPVSGLTGQGLDGLLAAIDAALVADPLTTVSFRIPQSEGRVIAALERGATIERQRFEGNLLYMTATGPASLLHRYRRFLAKEEAVDSAA